MLHLYYLILYCCLPHFQEYCLYQYGHAFLPSFLGVGIEEGSRCIVKIFPLDLGWKIVKQPVVFWGGNDKHAL